MAEAINETKVAPDLFAAILCEDIRTEASGQQSLIGVFSAIPSPVVPIRLLKLCVWVRWGGGIGQFNQRFLILDSEEDKSIVSANVSFRLEELEHHATNVHVFGGLQFSKYGIYHVEIYLDDDLCLRFPLPVIPVGTRSSN